MIFHQVLFELLLDGYKIDNEDTADQIDKDEAEKTSCPECDSKMEHIGMRKTKSYRSFAVCVDSQCNESVEF